MGKREAKAQSAMEYVTTYGWAILVVIVVLAALFQLGVFNSNVLAPRAPPGACQVYRPYGPVNVRLISLSGICTGELPQYVGNFNNYPGPATQYIGVNLTAFQNQGSTINELTASAWFTEGQLQTSNICAVGLMGQMEGNGGGSAGVAQGWSFEAYRTCDNAPFISFLAGNGVTQANGGLYGIGTSSLEPDTWYFVAGTINGNVISLYLNGQFVANTVVTSGVANTQYPFSIGVYGWNGCLTCFDWWQGSIANIQLYNTSFSANEVQQLYVEGIGGAPTRLQNLVGWWTLDGNANDYSGNGRNGTTKGLSYSSDWTSQYTPQ
ncbi:MAG: LamG domain-containing protein [Candidatus Marsarchaeota archaeon]|nr:LamG domain-containing protein [Candidatus Marsarchaeota archaeon]